MRRFLLNGKDKRKEGRLEKGARELHVEIAAEDRRNESRGTAWKARTRGDPAAGRETRGRVYGKFINHGDRHGRYLRTQSAHREHRKKPICPRLLVDEQKAVAETEVAWKEEEEEEKQDGDRRGGRGARKHANEEKDERRRRPPPVGQEE